MFYRSLQPVPQVSIPSWIEAERTITDTYLLTALIEQPYNLADENCCISHTLKAMAKLYRSAASIQIRHTKS